MSTHARRQQILAWLRENKSATAEEAAAAFNVSLRTLHRDLAALRYSGVPIQGEPGRGGGLRVDPLATMPAITFSGDEAAGLYLTLKVAEAVGTPTASGKAILKKVSDALPDDRVKELEEFLKRVIVKKGGGQLSDDGLLGTLEEAFRTNQGLRFDAGKKTHTIHVQGLAFAGGKVHILGVDDKNEKAKTYDASKVKKPRILKSVEAKRVGVAGLKKLLK